MEDAKRTRIERTQAPHRPGRAARWAIANGKDRRNDVATERDKRVAGEAPTGPVAIFIDWDNFAIGLRQEMPKQPADLGPILRWVRRFGPLMVCRAYGEWRDPAERLAIYNAGVEVVYAPVLPLGGSVMARDGGGAKSLADTAMAVDVTEMLSLIPGLSTLVLATSDKDLIPVLRFAQRRGLYAVIIGSDRTAGALRELADEFISYRQLLELESGGAPTPRPGTVPPLRFPRGFQASITPLPSSATPSAGALPAPSAAAAGRPARTAAPAAVSTGDSTATASSAPATRPGAGSAMATEEEEAGATTVTARRRRRGGRRRGAGDLAVSATAPESAAEPASEEAEPPVEAEAGESPPPTMMAAATSPALPLPPVPAIAEPTPAGESRGVRATPGSIGLVEPAPVAGEAGAPPDAPLVAATAPTEPVRQEPPLPTSRARPIPTLRQSVVP